MSSSKFANLEGVDFEAPDVYETHSPSPTRKSRNLDRPGRSGRHHASQSSDEDSEDDEGDESDSGGRSGRRGTKKVGGERGVPDHDNPDIVGTALDPTEAAKRFQKATGVGGQDVDFSTSINRRKKRPQYYPPPNTYETTTYTLGSGTGYRTSGGGLGPGDEEPWTKTSGEKEKPIDKFRRLRFEIEELEKELDQEANAPGNHATEAKEQPKSQSKGGDKKNQEGVNGLTLQVSALKDHLMQVEDRQAVSEVIPSAPWNTESRRKLLEQLSIQGQKETVKSGVDVATKGEATEEVTAGSRLLSQLDRRLAGLEELVGVRDALVDETKSLPRPLLPALARIEHLLTLLTHPRHLDGISRRIKVLVSELERLHEARKKLAITGAQQQQQFSQLDGGVRTGTSTNLAGENGGGVTIVPVETMEKLDTVLPTLSRIEPMMPLVPALLGRLHSLATLHTRSNTFVEDMMGLETSLKRSHNNHEELKATLANLEKSIAENQQRMQSNLQVIEERMTNITQRMQNLQQGT